MWLLHSETLKLHQFFGSKIPLYGILSHTWQDEEVTFRDLYHDEYFGKKDYLAYEGWTKIKSFCKLVKDDGYEYAWVDTCCIDKSSSAELSEAINSMFNWYRNAAVCFAFLSDVDQQSNIIDSETIRPFRQSRWFRRGWTLQELLAPEAITFFDRNWTLIGSRSNLDYDISKATGIDISFLNSFNSLDSAQASIAQKMFWASTRATTRAEDMAYCLMGIFDINMPLLYGEGGIKAFLRLQEEIIKASNDESLFAWRDTKILVRGIFAESPALFYESRNTVRLPLYHGKRPPYTLTHRGLQITAQCRRASKTEVQTSSVLRRVVIALAMSGKCQVFRVSLACGEIIESQIRQTGIYLLRVSIEDGIYVRTGNLTECRERSSHNRVPIYILQNSVEIQRFELSLWESRNKGSFSGETLKITERNGVDENRADSEEDATSDKADAGVLYR